MLPFSMYGIGIGYAVIMGVVLIAVITYTIVAVKKQAKEQEKKERNPELRRIEKRYRRGEISKQEYEEKRKRLTSN